MALNEIAKHFYEKEVDRLLDLDDRDIIKNKFLDMRSQIDDLYVELGERARRIVELEKESERPATGGVDRVFAFGKEMDIRELFDELLKVNKRIAELESELEHSREYTEALRGVLGLRSAKENIELANKLYGLNFEVSDDEEPLPFSCDKCEEETKTELPTMPIDVASMLINATIEYPTISLLKAFGAGETSVADKYSKSDLREIAEHLLVYCNNSDENSNTKS